MRGPTTHCVKWRTRDPPVNGKICGVKPLQIAAVPIGEHKRGVWWTLSDYVGPCSALRQEAARQSADNLAAAADADVDNGRHSNDDDVTNDEQQQPGYVEVRSTRRRANESISGPVMTSRRSRRNHEEAQYASIDHRIAGHTYILVVDD